MSRIRILAAAAAISICAAGSATAETIRFSVSAEPYPPFASKTASGKWEGFEVDLIHAICAEMKAKCEVKATSWDGIIPALTSKKIDVIFASMSITDERKKTIDFSIPYYNTPAEIVAAKDSSIGITPESLKGKTIGVQTSTIHYNFASKYFSKVANIKTYGSQDEANADLSAGRLDATIADSAALDPLLKSEAGTGLAVKGTFPKDDPIWGEGVGAGIRKGDTKLEKEINDAIRAIYKDGTYAQIEKKYFSYDVGTPPKG